MKLGTSKVDITPTTPVELAGFAHRTGKTNEVFIPIYLRSFLFTNNGTHSLWIIADLIWWDMEDVERWKRDIHALYDVPISNIVFHATHNHSGPQVSNRFSRQLGARSEQYVTSLHEKILKSVKDCFTTTCSVTCKKYNGISNVGVYRRKTMNEVVQMAPNLDQSIDREINIIEFSNHKNEKIAMFVQFACHPTTTDANQISSEFPGYFCNEMENDFPNCNVAFLQGFSGDIRPALIDQDKFYRGTVKDLKKIGKEFYHDVLDTLQSDGIRIPLEQIKMKEVKLEIDFEKKASLPRMPEELTAEWEMLTRKISKYPLKFQYIHFDEQLKFLTANAEMVHAYGNYLKQMHDAIIPVGYCNGMIGYIPTQKQLEEGGYEAEESIFYFGYPHKIKGNMEKRIVEIFRLIIEEEINSVIDIR